MIRLLSAIVAILVFLFASTAPAAAVTNGTPDEDWHSYVGLLVGNGWSCTGTLIAPSVMLTAGHCVNNFGGSGTAEHVMVSFAPSNDFENFTYDTTGSLMYAEPLGYDVGLVFLNDDMSHLGQGSLPAEWSVESLPNKTPLTAVGYGFNGYAPDGGPPQAVGGGTRMWATTEFINNNHNYAPQFLKLSTNPGQGKGGTCHGDSGGPIFAGDQVTILGIASWGGQNCNRLSYAQRMDLPAVQAWVTGCMADQSTCLTPPA